jgi:hypothetical protein
MSPPLATVLRDWCKIHPGGQFTFCCGLDVNRIKTASRDEFGVGIFFAIRSAPTVPLLE